MQSNSSSQILTLNLPVSEEALGRWLESRNARIEVDCALGRYRVAITCHSLQSYREEGDVSFRRAADFEVTVYSTSFNEAMAAAMRAVEAEEAVAALSDRALSRVDKAP